MPLSAGEGDNARSGTIFVGRRRHSARVQFRQTTFSGVTVRPVDLYKLAYIDPRGNLTYGHLGGRIEQFAIGLEFSSQPEERVLMCLLDTIDWPTVFLDRSMQGGSRFPSTRC